MAVVKTKDKSKVKKAKRTVQKGVVHISSTFNNTIISITDAAGGVIAASSAGAVGFSVSANADIVTGKQIGRASCRERVCLYV